MVTENTETLLERFKKTLEYAQSFDVLVGYFRTIGFHRSRFPDNFVNYEWYMTDSMRIYIRKI